MKTRTRTHITAVLTLVLTLTLAMTESAGNNGGEIRDAQTVLKRWATERAWICAEIVKKVGYANDRKKIVECMAALGVAWSAAATKKIMRKEEGVTGPVKIP